MKRLVWLVMLIGGSAAAAPTPNAVTLETVMRQTVDRNPEIQQAKLRLEQAAGRRLVLRSVGFPDMSLGGLLGDQGGHRAEGQGDQPFGVAFGGLNQVLFNVAVPHSFRRGNLEVMIAEQELNVAMTTQLHDARLAFYTAMYNRDLGKIRANQLRRLQQNAASQAQRYQSGVVSRAISVGAQVESNELQPKLDTSDRAFHGAELKMVEAMGENLGPSAFLPEPAGELKYVAIDIDLPREVTRTLQQRPDLELARLMVRASHENERILAAAYYPTVNLNVGGEYIPVTGVRQTQSQGSPRRSDDIISSEIRAGVAYTWKVMDSGRTYGEVKQERSAREINEIMLHKLEQDIPRDMARIHHELSAIADKQKVLAAAADAAQHNALTVEENLSKGIVSQIEFRQAQTAALELQSSLLTLAYQQHVAMAEWDRATGRYLAFSDAAGQNVP